jgi:hypothetical protein
MRFESEDASCGEGYFLTESGVRKGRVDGTGRDNPCTVKVGLTTKEAPPRIVLRTVDKNGTGTMVAILDSESAKRIAEALLQASKAVE